MKIRTAPVAWAGIVVLALGCSKVSKDTSRVIASIGPEKITEQAFAESIRAMVKDEAKAKAFLTEEAQREERNGFLGNLAQAKQVIALGKATGLDKDPSVLAMMESMTARAYMQTLIDRRLPKAPPTDEQLKALYDELVAERKAAGQTQPLPTFEQVKGQLPMLWQQQQQKKVIDEILKEAKEKTPATIADDYKSAKPAM